MEHTAFADTYNAALILADGAVFFGFGVGATGTTLGEICFNTAMTGYQEILTDPSYAGQIITFTFPHIGNVGTNEEDVESRQAFAHGLVLHDTITPSSNFRSTLHFNDWLIQHKLTGIAGIDTRALTCNTRKNGPQNVAIAFAESIDAIDIDTMKEELAKHPPMNGLELAKHVTRQEQDIWQDTIWTREHGYRTIDKEQYNVVAIDYGVKHNILRHLATLGCKVTIVSADTSAQDILALKPDGIFLSNGPGDPSATAEYAVPIIKELLATPIPLFGICLGHQLLALALGCRTEKMAQGQRGANHPVKNLQTGYVEITSQNHGFTVMRQDLPNNVIETHRSLFDGTIEGIRLKDRPVFSVQHHPEASPGPHDSEYLFKEFITLMQQGGNYDSNVA